MNQISSIYDEIFYAFSDFFHISSFCQKISNGSCAIHMKNQIFRSFEFNKKKYFM